PAQTDLGGGAGHAAVLTGALAGGRRVLTLGEDMNRDARNGDFHRPAHQAEGRGRRNGGRRRLNERGFRRGGRRRGGGRGRQRRAGPTVIKIQKLVVQIKTVQGV